MMTFSHQQRQDILLHFLVSLSKGESTALLFGRVHRDPKPRKGDYHFNLRLSRYDHVGLHCLAPQSLAEDLKAGDEIMALADIKARETVRRPYLTFNILYLAASDADND